MERDKCNVASFMDVTRKLAEEILRKESKTELEKEFIYKFTLMVLNGLIMEPKDKDCKGKGCH